MVAKCTQSVTYRRKLYRPIRTSSQVAHRPLNYWSRPKHVFLAGPVFRPALRLLGRAGPGLRHDPVIRSSRRTRFPQPSLQLSISTRSSHLPRSQPVGSKWLRNRGGCFGQVNSSRSADAVLRPDKWSSSDRWI